MKWLGREEWRHALNELLDRHLGPACAKANVSFDKLSGIVGDHHSGILWGCVFKDLLARDLDDGRNRRRLSEAERLERECLQQSVMALRSSAMSEFRYSTGGFRSDPCTVLPRRILAIHACIAKADAKC